MREILFRGKDIKEHWHTGLLAHVGNAWYISNGAGIPTAYEVIPSTIGQYTGMSDNNGKPIFEGDILKLGTGKTRFVFYGISSFRHTIYNGYAKEFDFKDRGYQVIGNIFDNTELLRSDTDEMPNNKSKE